MDTLGTQKGIMDTLGTQKGIMDTLGTQPEPLFCVLFQRLFCIVLLDCLLLTGLYLFQSERRFIGGSIASSQYSYVRFDLMLTIKLLQLFFILDDQLFLFLDCLLLPMQLELQISSPSYTQRWVQQLPLVFSCSLQISYKSLTNHPPY